jgi:hypothetical protein
MGTAGRRIAANALLAAAAGCLAPAPSRDVVRRDSAGVVIVENRVPASPRGGWRLDIAAARPIDIPSLDGESRAAAVAMLPGGGFAVADAGGRIAWFDRRGRRTRSVALAEHPTLGALYARSTGALVAWDADRLAALDVGADGSPSSVRSYETSLPPGTVMPLGAFGDGSLLMSVRDARIFQVADEPGRDTVAVLRLGPRNAHAGVFSIPGPEELTWGGAGGAIRIPAPFGREVRVAVSGDRAWVADGVRGELRAYDAAGRLRAIVRAPIRGDPVDSAEVARWRERLRRLARGYVQDDARARLEGSLVIPDTWPPFAALLAGPHGELWVRAGGAPDGDARWNVFAMGGRWLSELVVPTRLDLAAVGEGYVIARERQAEAAGRLVSVPLLR